MGIIGVVEDGKVRGRAPPSLMEMVLLIQTVLSSPVELSDPPRI